MDSMSIIGMASVIASAICMGIGSIGTGLGEGKAVQQALKHLPLQRRQG